MSSIEVAMPCRTGELAQPAPSLWRAKLILAAVLTLWISLPYYSLQHCVVFPVRVLEPWAIERAIPFAQAMAWPYLSLYLLLALAPLAVTTRRDLRRFAVDIVIVGLVSDLMFLFWPTSVARPDAAATDYAYRLVVAADNSLNACPSLHASLAVYVALWCRRLMRGRRGGFVLGLTIWLWVLVILYATLAARQHVLMDLLAGAALTGFVFAVSGRWERARRRASSEGDDMEAPISQPLSWQQARTIVLRGIEEQLAPLRAFNTRKRLIELTVVVSMWMAGATLTVACHRQLQADWLRYLLCAVGVVLSAIALNAFVLLLHEGMHSTLFARPFWNRWLSVLLGVPVLMSFSAYQVMHLRHHTYLGDPRDPDDYANYSSRPRLVWLMHFMRLLCGAFLYLLLIPVLGLRHGTPPQRRWIVVEYLLLAATAATAGWFVPGDVLLWGWFLPVVLVGYMTNLRGFTQHGITDEADPFLASRTMKPNPLVAFCLLNENYHLEHHLFPEVPSYHLRRLHETIWPRLPRAVVGRSYWAFLGRFLRATLTFDATPIGLTCPRREQGQSQHEESAA
ncbi:MAG TPA: fatty acid desaturase [Gemmataceae bacterium]|jgi:fatty acid desaturase